MTEQCGKAEERERARGNVCIASAQSKEREKEKELLLLNMTITAAADPPYHLSPPSTKAAPLTAELAVQRCRTVGSYQQHHRQLHHRQCQSPPQSATGFIWPIFAMIVSRERVTASGRFRFGLVEGVMGSSKLGPYSRSWSCSGIASSRSF